MEARAIRMHGAENPKKAGGAFLEHHRLKNGIPKEEEERSRKPMVPEQFLQRNIIFLNLSGSLSFSHLFY
jgi:hypothetical protein